MIRGKSVLRGRRLVARLTLFLFLLAAFTTGPAVSVDKALYHTKVYNPESRSYFELVKAVPGDSIRGEKIPEITWRKAVENASRMNYKGVSGRLAVVKSRQTNDFLARTFQPDRAPWIGLRYWCSINRLQWVTGELSQDGDYANWGLIWAHQGGTPPSVYADEPNCNDRATYWPIHYWSIHEGFTWNANGWNKERFVYFVEYPTGQP